MGEAVEAGAIGAAVQPGVDLGQPVGFAGLEEAALEGLQDVLGDEVADRPLTVTVWPDRISPAAPSASMTCMDPPKLAPRRAEEGGVPRVGLEPTPYGF